MSEFNALMKILAEGMTSFARGIDELATRIESLASMEGVVGRRAVTPSPAGVRKRPGRPAIGETTAGDTVLNLIAKAKRGIDIYTLKQETGFDDKKIYNIIYRLNKQGKIKPLRTGVYVKA